MRLRRERDVLLSNLPVEQLNRSEQQAYALAVADGLGGHAFGEARQLPGTAGGLGPRRQRDQLANQDEPA